MYFFKCSSLSRVVSSSFILLILIGTITCLGNDIFEFDLKNNNIDSIKRDFKIHGYTSPGKVLVSYNNNGLGQRRYLDSIKPYKPNLINHRDKHNSFIVKTTDIDGTMTYMNDCVRNNLALKIKRLHTHEFFVITASLDSFSNQTRFCLSQCPYVIYYDYVHKHSHHIYFGEKVMNTRRGLTHHLGGGLLNGEGVVVGISDTGLDYNHCFFKGSKLNGYIYNGYNSKEISELIKKSTMKDDTNRQIAYISLMINDNDDDGSSGIVKNIEKTDFIDEIGGHGTHTSGALFGDSTNCGKDYNLGGGQIISKSKYIFVDLENNQKSNSVNTDKGLIIPYVFSDLLQILYDNGVRIFSNSWGSNINAYTFNALDIDEFVYNHDDFIVLFSNGNSGPNWGTVGSPATAKNIISVGASQNSAESFHFLSKHNEYWEGGGADNTTLKYIGNWYNLADFSSRGPTFDGRMKPNNVVVGEYTLSAMAYGILECMRGTSMSCPLLGRKITHILQYFYQTKHIKNPSVALIMSILATTSIPLTGKSSKLVNKTNTIIGFNRKGPITEMDEGYGLVSLPEEILDDIYFLDRQKISPVTSSYQLCFKPIKASLTTISIAWIDPPVYKLYSKDSVLINDFDLHVIVNNETYTTHDHLNNHERIQLYLSSQTSPSTTLIKIMVVQGGGRKVIPNSQFAISMYPKLEPVNCNEECTKFDPLLMCNLKGGNGDIIGYRECLNSTIDKQNCYPTCNNNNNLYYFKNDICQCLNHIQLENGTLLLCNTTSGLYTQGPIQTKLLPPKKNHHNKIKKRALMLSEGESPIIRHLGNILEEKRESRSISPGLITMLQSVCGVTLIITAGYIYKIFSLLIKSKN